MVSPELHGDGTFCVPFYTCLYVLVRINDKAYRANRGIFIARQLEIVGPQGKEEREQLIPPAPGFVFRLPTKVFLQACGPRLRYGHHHQASFLFQPWAWKLVLDDGQ